MTTQTPTSKLEGVDGVQGLVPAPAHLPDEAALGRWASALFAALPNQTPVLESPVLPSGDPKIGVPAHAPQPSDSTAALAGRIPALVQGQSRHAEIPAHLPNLPNHLESHPDRIRQSLPMVGGAHLPQVPIQPTIPSSPELSVPALALPHAPSASGSPFYFVDEFAAPPVARPELALPQQALQPTAFGLPSDGQLQALLSDTRHQSAPTRQDFYFLNPPVVAAPAAAYHGGTWQQPAVSSSDQPFDVHAVRRDFPILQEQVNGRQLVWLDNAATTHKPQQVIERISYFYQHENSNIHRAAHELAARATDAYEHARRAVARFLGAASEQEIVFVRGTTEAINLIAKSWGVQNIGAGDEIIVSHLEHHANIVPWYQLAQQVGAKLRVIPVDDSGQIQLSALKPLINPRTKLVSITQVSNALGTVTPVAEVIEMAHQAGVRVLVDGAQAVSHMRVDVQALDADFYVFSGHKVFGPTGIGAFYAKPELLEQMPPWQGGGNMIADVTFEQVIFQPAPNKFEAGTGNIADAVGLGAAIEYVERLGMDNIARYEHDLLEYGTHALQQIQGLRLIGTAREKASVMSFVLDGYSTEQVGKALNQEGIAVRTGHHCAQPILRRFGVEATVRPSLAFYNTTEEIDRLVAVLHRLKRRTRGF